MVDRIRSLNWLAALGMAALVLPVSVLFALADDRLCNRLEGDIEVAERGTPRGEWCAALQWDAHWLLVVVMPAVVVLGLVLAAGRRTGAYVPIWIAGVALAAWPAIVMSGLRAYPEL